MAWMPTGPGLATAIKGALKPAVADFDTFLGPKSGTPDFGAP